MEIIRGKNETPPNLWNVCFKEVDWQMCSKETLPVSFYFASLNCDIIWLSPFNCGPLPFLSALSNKQYRNLLSGENCRTHALTWLLQQAHANQNHSRACFMSLKELVLPGAEVPYLLGDYRFLVWSLLSFRIKLPFFPLLTWKPPSYFSCSPCLLACWFLFSFLK